MSSVNSESDPYTNISEHEEDYEENYSNEEESEQSNQLKRRKMSGSGLPIGFNAAQMKAELGMLLGGGQSRINKIVSKLDSPDMTEQMMALTELCDLLSMSTEESLLGFRSEPIISSLLKCMQIEYNEEIMLLASRALSHLMEALPGCISSVVATGGIPILVEKLLNIGIIDLAEQSLVCLEKISAENPTAVLKEGGLAAQLTFVDFFNISLQRKVAASAIHMVKKATIGLLPMIEPSIPKLAELLQSEDTKLVENVCQVFYRLAVNFQNDPDADKIFSTIATQEVLTSLLKLFERDRNCISSSTWPYILKQLIILSRVSIRITESLIEWGAVDTLFLMLSLQSDVSLTGGDTFGKGGSPPAALRTSKGMSTDTISDIVELLEVLLPQIDSGLLSELGPGFSPQVVSSLSFSPGSPNLQREASSQSGISFGTRGPSALMEQDDEEGPEEEEEDPEIGSPNPAIPLSTPVRVALDKLNQDRIALFTQNEKFMTSTSNGLCTIIDIYTNTVHRYTKQRCLSAVAAILHHTSGEMLEKSLASLPISSFIASMIHTGELLSIATGLHVAISLMNKLPKIFSVYFVREGVIMEISTLLKKGNSADQQMTHILKSASGFVEHHFAGDKAVPQRLEDLKKISEMIKLTPSNSPTSKCQDNLKELRSLISGDGISTFEFIQVDLIGALLQFFVNDELTEEQKIMRAKSFIEIFASTAEYSQQFCNIVIKLVASLHQSETLPTYITDHGAGSRGGWSSSLRLLAQPFKLLLVDKSKVTPNTTVMVEPLATIGAVQEFIQNRVQVEKEFPHNTHDGEQHLFNDLHPHPLTCVSGKPSGWTCDICSSGFRGPGPTRWRCARCDYDICGECSGNQYDESEASTPASGAQNPVTPPQQMARRFKRDSNTNNPSSSSPAPASRERSEKKEKKSLWPLSKHKKKKEKEKEKEREREREQREKEESNKATVSPAVEASSSSSSSKKASGTPAPTPTATVEISLNGNVLSSGLSLFKAIHKFGNSKGSIPEPVSGTSEMVHTNKSMWTSTYELSYALVSNDKSSANDSEEAIVSGTDIPIKLNTVGEFVGSSGCCQYLENANIHKKYAVAEEYGNILGPEPTLSVLRLLSILRALNENIASIAHCELPNTQQASTAEIFPIQDHDFRSHKLTNKVLRQILDGLLLCTGHPNTSWCRVLFEDASYLYSFQTRLTFFELASFGPSRSMIRLQEILEEQGEECSGKLARAHKQKIRLERQAILESAKKIMSVYGSQRSYLEFEYFGEVGTGLGPTLEFYTLVSQSLKEDAAQIWMPSTESSNFGLFPRPMLKSDKNFSDTISMFKFVGQFVARAMYDRRIVDIPFSPPMLKIILGESLSVADLNTVNPSIATTVLEFLSLSKLKNRLQQSDPSITKQQLEEQLTIKEVMVKDLSLDFTLPGFPDIELCPNGKDVEVTIDNMEEYATAVSDMFLKTGIQAQITALWQGATQVFPLSQIRLFSVEELDLVLCGSSDQLCLQTLESAVVCDHGYTPSSKAVGLLFDILSKFTSQELRKFFMFVTGAPRLPPGGLKSLKPPLTVVRKTPDSSVEIDDVLPSVMTCQNYLKLPDYSSAKIMKAKLLVAMTEGANAFHLS